MTTCNKRCQYCHRWFNPNKRKVGIQKTCKRRECQGKRQAGTSRRWRGDPDNSVSYQARRAKILTWAKEEDYWKERRRRSPGYRQREAERMRNKRKDASNQAVSLQTVAKQISITEISVEERVRSLGVEVVSVAKRISIESFFIGKPREEVGGVGPFFGDFVAKQISTLWEKGRFIMRA